VKVELPPAANLANINTFFRNLDMTDPTNLAIHGESKWITVHPIVLSVTAALGLDVLAQGGTIAFDLPYSTSVNYLTRMKLYELLRCDPPKGTSKNAEGISIF